MNKVRRLAEDLVNQYPTIFGPDFDKNKESLAQVTIVRTRSLRNQLAGAITRIIHERGPAVAESEEKEVEEVATIEERARIEGTRIPTIPKEDTQDSRSNDSPSSGSDDAPKDTENEQEKTDQEKK